jgi:hypothetical protein
MGLKEIINDASSTIDIERHSTFRMDHAPSSTVSSASARTCLKLQRPIMARDHNERDVSDVLVRFKPKS